MVNINKKETSLELLNKNIDNSSIILQDNKPINVGKLNIPDEFIVEKNENITLDNQFNDMNNMSIEFDKKKEEFDKNDLEFSEKLNKIQQDRKIEFDNNLSENNHNPYLPIEVDESWESKNIYDTESKKILERNEIEKEIIQQKKIDPQELFTENEDITKLYNETIEHVGVRNEIDVIQKSSENKFILETFLSLNSLDRNFDVLNTKNTRYSYEIKFSPMTDEWVQVPVYENGLFKMPNAEQARIGIRGDVNLDFDESRPPGNIIGHQYLFYKGNRGASINRIFRNVTSVKLQYLIKPLDNLCMNFNAMGNILTPKFALNTLSYPYLLLYIKEIDGELDGTNHLDKAFAKLVINKDYCPSKINPSNISKNCSKDNGYLHYTVVAGGEKNFPKPINILDSITIQLLTPQGTPLNVNPDTFLISSIFAEIDNSDSPSEIFIKNGEGENMVSFMKKDYIIQIVTDKKFYTKSLTSGMMILLKNINTGNLIYDKFLNKEEGHIVLGSRLSSDINDNNIQLMSDTIYIQNYDLNCYGENNDNHTSINYVYTPEDCDDTQIIEDHYKPPPILINMSLQNSLIFSINTEETKI